MKKAEDLVRSEDWQIAADKIRFRTVIAALITSDKPLTTAAALAEGPLNLYKTLEPMHLAKAMATGLITWDALLEWTSQTQTPTRRIPEDTTWERVVRPTQTPYIDVNRRPPRTTIMRRQLGSPTGGLSRPQGRVSTTRPSAA